jgi:hypothetical protein
MTTGLPATLPQVAAVVLDLLSQQRCLDWDELLDGLERSRLDLGDDPEDLLDEVLGSEHLPLVMPTGVDRWADLPALLAGHVATHRVTAAEAGADLLVSVPRPRARLGPHERRALPAADRRHTGEGRHPGHRRRRGLGHRPGAGDAEAAGDRRR